MITFGTDGWYRTLADNSAGQQLRAIAGALARYLVQTAPGQRVLIGYDNQPLAKQMARVAWEAMAAAGMEALVTEGAVALPAFASAVPDEGAASGLMLTAADQATGVGLQLMAADGGPLPLEALHQLEEAARQGAAEGEGALSEQAPAFDPAPGYTARLQRLINFEAIRASGATFATDAMHGTGAPYLSLLAPAVALRQADGPAVGGRLDADGLVDLIRAVQESGAAVGLATNGDASRFAAVDPRWGLLTANQALSLILWYLAAVKGEKGLVVRSVATSHLLDRIALRHGCGLLETPVGWPYMARVMRTQEVLIAGEAAGALALGGHIPAPDGILACLLLAQIRAETGRSLRDLVIQLYDTYGPTITKRIDQPLAPGARQRIEERLSREEFPEKFAGRWVISLDRKDGYKFLLGNDTWALVRFTEAEDVAQVYGEAQHPAVLEAVLRDVVAELGRP